MSKAVYIAGPMRGYPEFNFPAFLGAEDELRRVGLILDDDWVFNPARRDIENGFDPKGMAGTVDELEAVGFDLAASMKADLDFIVNDASLVVMLPGWSKSTGACHEKATAELCGKRVLYYQPPHTSDYGGRRSGTLRTEPLPEDEPQSTSTTGGEVRAEHSTGAQKGRKPEAMSLLPPEAVREVARVYNYGATKYDAHNWRSGYPFSWSLDALLRHVFDFIAGKNVDAESGLHPLGHAAFHCFSIITWMAEGRTDLDDRWAPGEPKAESSEQLQLFVTPAVGGCEVLDLDELQQQAWEQWLRQRSPLQPEKGHPSFFERHFKQRDVEVTVPDVEGRDQ